MLHRPASRISSLVLLGLAACASGGQAAGPEQQDQLVTWVERVHVEAERSRQAIADSFERLNTLAAGRFDKEPAAVVYAKFVQSIDSAEQQRKRFREVVGPMLESGKPLFTRRQQELQAISGDRLRQRGEVRFAIDKERYDAVTTAAVPAQDQFDAFVKALQDHAAFLQYDLNPGSIAEIQPEVKIVARSARELDHNMESCQAAARAFVEGSALPAVPAR